ncbi:MAG: hypothetical protein Q4D28_10340, partial [Prevotellaceae bacterium]|nr:hypothetical protein [Prevotellaceae bacterium]
GNTSNPYKRGLRVRRLDVFSSLFVIVCLAWTAAAAERRRSGGQDIVVQLLDAGDKPVREQKAVDGTAEFYYLAPGTYYMRAFIDANGNGRWDTGDYLEGRQPEEVYYYNGTVECKAKWDITKEWTLDALPLDRQKPAAITKQKAEAERKIQNRNAQRAQQLGVEPPAR